ncbi:unnamed protein product [Cochlearia groenlandica]
MDSSLQQNSKFEEAPQVPISLPHAPLVLEVSTPHEPSSSSSSPAVAIFEPHGEDPEKPDTNRPGSESKIEDPLVPISLPHEPIGRLDDSMPHEPSSAAIAIVEPHCEDSEKPESERPGSDFKIESDSVSEENPIASSSESPNSPKPESVAIEEEDEPTPKKQKKLDSITTTVSVKEEVEPEPMVIEETTTTTANNPIAKKSKSKKKNNNVWVTKSTRKGKKKSKTNTPNSTAVEDKVLITPVPRFLDKGDDTLESVICLSKVYKAEKVEISEDRLTAESSKGYRMVRATRGVVEGAWYFEIKVVNLGETGHTRLGWSNDKGELQAPVGYDGNSFGFRDIDGCKIHKASREKYAEEGYKEGDVIGFYINLPDGESFAPKPPHYVWYKGQRYICAPDTKEEPPKAVPGSEISFFKNGVCQGVAFKDLFGGRYYPAASMYTLPDQSNCAVKFNFGPDFEFYPEDFGGRATPKPMLEVPYHGFNGNPENNGSDDMKS